MRGRLFFRDGPYAKNPVAEYPQRSFFVFNRPAVLFFFRQADYTQVLVGAYVFVAGFLHVFGIEGFDVFFFLEYVLGAVSAVVCCGEK